MIAGVSEHMPPLQYRCTEVNCIIYNIGTPEFLGISQDVYVFRFKHMPPKVQLYGNKSLV